MSKTETNEPLPDWSESDVVAVPVPFVASKPTGPTPIYDRMAAAWLIAHEYTISEMIGQFAANIKYARERVNAV